MDRKEFMSKINNDLQKRYVDCDLHFGNKHGLHFDVDIRHQISELSKPDNMSDEEYNDVMNVYKYSWAMPRVRFYASLNDEEKLVIRCELRNTKIEIGNSIIIHTFSNRVDSDDTYLYDDYAIDRLTRENCTECIFDDSNIITLPDEIWNMLERFNTILCFNNHWHLRLLRSTNYYFDPDFSGFPAYLRSYGLAHFIAIATKWYYTKCDISTLDI